MSSSFSLLHFPPLILCLHLLFPHLPTPFFSMTTDLPNLLFPYYLSFLCLCLSLLSLRYTYFSHHSRVFFLSLSFPLYLSSSSLISPFYTFILQLILPPYQSPFSLFHSLFFSYLNCLFFFFFTPIYFFSAINLAICRLLPLISLPHHHTTLPLSSPHQPRGPY